MTKEEMYSIAVGNIERHLGDVVDEESSADWIYSEAYTLAVDALIDFGVEPSEARLVASEIAQCYAQP